MKEQKIQVSDVIKVLINPRNENEDEPICNKIEQMNDKTLQSTEEMDKKQ